MAYVSFSKVKTCHPCIPPCLVVAAADAGDEWQEELLADSDDEQQCYHDAADAAAAQKEQGLNSAQSAGQEHSSQTGAGPSRRAGFNYHL